MKYYKTLDSLRAIAVLMVVLHHYMPNAKIGSLSFGYYGVDLFFTISGFLITSILLNQKLSNKSFSKILKNFYIRRTLRIFPIYFLFLFLLLFLQYFDKVKCWESNQMIYYFTYTSNLLFFKTGFQNFLVNHLWSLGVEEQFYLFWPWFVLIVKKEHLLYYILSFITIGIFTNVLGSIYGVTTIRFLPFSNFHTLGIGILLAYLVQSENIIMNYVRIYIDVLFVAGLALFFLNFFVFQNLFQPGWYQTIINEIVVIYFTSILVFRFTTDFNGPVKSVVNAKYLVFIGKISYGIYIYHKVIPSFLSSFLYLIGYKLDSGYMYFFICIFVTLIIAVASWYCIEKPILQLKNKYDY